MQLAINIPDNLIKYYDKEQFATEILLNNALMMYAQNKLSLSRSAEFAGMNIYEFIRECTKCKIPIINYSAEDLKKEVENLL